VSVLDAGSGQVLNTVSVGKGVLITFDAGFGGLALDETTGRAFVASPGSSVSVLDATSGAVLRTVAAGKLLRTVAVDERDRHVFVADYGGSRVSVLDARSGRIVRTVAVGRSPYALAVDQGTHRVFVANYDGNTVSVLDATR
jgi:YVTN family beta-propeller protein